MLNRHTYGFLGYVQYGINEDILNVGHTFCMNTGQEVRFYCVQGLKLMKERRLLKNSEIPVEGDCLPAILGQIPAESDCLPAILGQFPAKSACLPANSRSKSEYRQITKKENPSKLRRVLAQYYLCNRIGVLYFINCFTIDLTI